MKVRETLILVSAMLIMAVAGLFLFGASDVVAGIPELGEEAVVSAPADGDAPADFQTVSIDEEERREERRSARASGPAPTSGSVEGGIVLATEAVSKLQNYTIILQEEINGNTSTKKPVTIQKTFKMPDRRSPYFEVKDVPFSEYGYRISVFAQGFNGSSRIIKINELSPYAADVRLAITPGAPFCIRLHDQHHNPSTERQVRLVPVGSPVGRSMLNGTSDSFGSLTFTGVLQGDYKILVEDNEIETVQIFATRGTGNRNIQYRTILVPVGVPVRVEILDGNSWGVPNAKLVLYRIDTIQNIRIEGVTDESGVFEFPYISAGRYQLDISAEGFGRKNERVTIVKEAKDTITKIVKMPRL